MEFAAISLEEAQATTSRALGLDDALYLPAHPEAVAASIRRAASFQCPTTPGALIDAVLEVLSPIVDEVPTRDDVMALLEQMVSTGDLLELTEVSADRRSRLLYLGPPSFVEKAPGHYLLTGIRPLAAPLVGSEISVEPMLHTRTATLDPETAEGKLRAAGLHKINPAQWIGRPSAPSAADYVEQYRQRLSVGRAAGSVEGLTIIDPGTNTRYYRGRWRAPRTGDSGDYVGRRPQAYGADLWCAVRLNDGAPERLVDLPLDSATVPARDEAWRLQAAIDAANRTPLGYRVLAIHNSERPESVVDFFSPLPTWAERYLELVGNAVDKSHGALFSYRVANAALPELRSLLTETLWMSLLAG